MKKKERREAILYVNVKPSNKKWLKANYKKQGYSTLSEFTDDFLTEAIKVEKAKK